MANDDERELRDYEAGLSDWPHWSGRGRVWHNRPAERAFPRGMRYGAAIHRPPVSEPEPLTSPPGAQPSFNGALTPQWWRFGAADYGPWHRGFMGRGPRSYRRTDARIEEEVNDALTMSPDVDASDIEVSVDKGIVRLTGVVDDRHQKRIAEELAEFVMGVHDIDNDLKVRHGIWSRLSGEHATDREVERKPVREPVRDNAPAAERGTSIARSTRRARPDRGMTKP